VRVFLFCAKDYFISIAIFMLDDGFCLNRQELFLFFYSVDMMTDTALQQQTDQNNRTLVTEQERELTIRNLYEFALNYYLDPLSGDRYWQREWKIPRLPNRTGSK
jgi:hypothetical protein